MDTGIHLHHPYKADIIAFAPGEVPERLNGTVSKTVVGLVPTVGSNPTLSAGRKILVVVKAAHYRQPQSFGDMVLTDRGLKTEIAQFQLGDLTFKVHSLFYILDEIRHDADRRSWIESFVTPEDNCDVREDTRKVSTGIEIMLQIFHNTLTRAEEYI